MKRFFALLLCIFMVLSLIPAAFAENAEDIEIVDVSEETGEEDLITIVDPTVPTAPETEAVSSDPILASGTCGDDVRWQLWNGGQLDITGTGPMWDFPDEEPGYAAYADMIHYVNITEGVTSVGAWAFCDKYDDLEMINFPGTLLEIGNSSFRGSGLAAVSFPASLQSIVGWAFEDCGALRQIAFHGSAPDLNYACFSGVSATVLYPRDDSSWTIGKIGDYYSVHHINGEAETPAEGTLTWKDVRYCGDFAYYEIKNRVLTIAGSGMITAGATEGESMFLPMMDQFDSVSIANGMAGIGAFSFAGLSNMKTIRIPAGMDRIAMGAFMDSGLTAFSFPDSPRLLMEGLFQNCTALRTVNIAGDPPGFSWGTFSGVTATIYYPANNPNWTDAVIERYYSDEVMIVGTGEDHLTWVPVGKPVITLHPQSVGAPLGEMVSFHAEAAGSNLSYQWYYRPAGEYEWISYTGGNSPTLTLEVKSYRNGYQYFCRVTNNYGSTSTKAALLTIVAKPRINFQPASVTASVGETVTFSVTATGGNLRYQWYYRPGSSGAWSKYNNVSSPTLDIEVKGYRNGYQYFCIVSNSQGSVSSKAATLTVMAKPVVTTHPQSVTAAVGENVTFTCSGEGADQYIWYYRPGSSGKWKQYTITSRQTLTVEAKAYRSGYQYFCLVSNAAGSTSSRAATLTVVSKPTITSQPQSVTAQVGQSVTFSVAATGATSYTWYYRTSSTGAWTKYSNTSSPTLTIEAKAYRSGYQYFCIVSNAAGSVSSKAATLTVN